MKVFKFGGTSVKDAESIKNVASIIKTEGANDTLVVISAMGKMTNSFEDVVDAYYNKTENLPNKLNFIEDYHRNIMSSLFDKEDAIYKDVAILFGELGWFLARNTSQRYNYVYDQIICFGELLSTRIVSAYLSKIGIENSWFDVRNCIKTDSNYRDAKVDWDLTEAIISKQTRCIKIKYYTRFYCCK